MADASFFNAYSNERSTKTYRKNDEVLNVSNDRPLFFYFGLWTKFTAPYEDSKRDSCEFRLLTSLDMNNFPNLSNSRKERGDKLFHQELCLIYLPYSTSLVLPRLCQSIFAHGYTPMAVCSMGEILIHSRQAKFAVIILPDDNVELIKKVRDPGGQNSSTPVVVISPTNALSESTLYLLENHMIQEVVVKATDMEKFERDMVSALNRVVRSSGNTEDIFSSFLPLQPQMATPVASRSPPLQGPMTCCAIKKEPEVVGAGTFINIKGLSDAPINNVPQEALVGCPSIYSFGPMRQSFDMARNSLLETMNVKTEREQIIFRKGGGEPNAISTAPIFQPLAQTPATVMGPRCHTEPGTGQGDVGRAIPRGLGLLPGIETLLDAIEVREAESAAQKTSSLEKEASGYTNVDSTRKTLTEDVLAKPPRFEKRETAPDADLPEAGDEKCPLSVAAQRPYFLTLDELKEKMADDPSARAVDRHNAKERHRRVRISKASDFFKAVVPCMKESMDKASSFYLTTYYLLFLRNALHRRDPTTLAKLRKTFKQEWSGVFNMQMEGPE